jgi:hypothetical protein
VTAEEHYADIALTVTEQHWGAEQRVSCTGCGYYRYWASPAAAQNDQLSHECAPGAARQHSSRAETGTAAARAEHEAEADL